MFSSSIHGKRNIGIGDVPSGNAGAILLFMSLKPISQGVARGRLTMFNPCPRCQSIFVINRQIDIYIYMYIILMGTIWGLLRRYQHIADLLTYWDKDMGTVPCITTWSRGIQMDQINHQGPGPQIDSSYSARPSGCLSHRVS